MALQRKHDEEVAAFRLATGADVWNAAPAPQVTEDPALGSIISSTQRMAAPCHQIAKAFTLKSNFIQHRLRLGRLGSQPGPQFARFSKRFRQAIAQIFQFVVHRRRPSFANEHGASAIVAVQQGETETPAPEMKLRVTNPATVAQFVGALADNGVKLPLLPTDEDVGTLTDADGKPVLVVDVDRERSDEDVAWIVSMIQVAVNTCGGFKAQRRDPTEGQP
jgi:hypothetical protein